MDLTNSSRIRCADRVAIEQRGITHLMETAAGELTKEALAIRRGDSAAVFCGSGNNGGDGIAAARFLMEHGLQVRAFLTGKREKMTPDSLLMEEKLQKSGGRLELFEPTDDVRTFVMNCGVIVDAIFGIGLNSPVRGQAQEAIEWINESPAPVVSVDIASGVEADTGRILGTAVRADRTVTFSLAKPGHFSDPGGELNGILRVADIGLPEDLLDSCRIPVRALTGADVALPKRPAISHKGTYGKVLIIGGATGMTGAPVLSAKAALRSGAGLVWLGVPEEIYPIAAGKNDEAMTFPFIGAEELLARAEVCDIAAIGPGMGRTPETVDCIRTFVSQCPKPLVIDADGLYALAQDMSILRERTAPTILTPHDVEFQRMGGQLTGDRTADALSFAKEHSCVVVLKGHHSVIAFPDGHAYINTTGNPGMAKGGSGDVLTGIAAAMIAQFGIEKGICLSVYLHGLAGDLCRDRYGEYAMLPTDTIRMLADAEKQICCSNRW